MNILAISGSLRANSINTSILQAITTLAPNRVLVSIYRGLDNLPHFNPELDRDCELQAVREWRTQLQASDGIVFCTPEYAHGIPGTLKNALDWIVSSGEFMYKPTAVISASPSLDGGEKANHALVQTLRVMMADIPTGAILCIPTVSAKMNDRGEIIDPPTVRSLGSLLTTLVETIDRASVSKDRV